VTTKEDSVVKSADADAEDVADVDEAVQQDGPDPAVHDHSITKRLVPPWLSRFRPRARTLVLVVVVVAVTGLAAWTYGYQYRPDIQSGDAAAQSAMRAAADGTVALLSYGPDSVNEDFASAKKHLTGDFLSYYAKFTEKVVAPAAKEKGVKTTAAVVQAAVSEIHPDSAVVLLFVNQGTTTKDRPEPSLTSSTVLVRMTKLDGDWLIAKFDPV
jgi:Mce-associated membrane protein